MPYRVVGKDALSNTCLRKAFLHLGANMLGLVATALEISFDFFAMIEVVTDVCINIRQVEDIKVLNNLLR